MVRVGVIAVVTIVILAGCGGFAGDDSGTEAGVTVTPAPIPPTTTPDAFPPRLTAQGVTNPAALADAHGAALTTSLTVSANQTVRGPNGTLRAQRNVTIHVASNHSRHHVVIAVAGPAAARLLGEPPVRAEFWSDGDLYMRAYTRDKTTRYNTFEPTLSSDGRAVGTTNYWLTTVAPGGQPWSDIQPLFRAFDARRVERIDLRNRRVYRVTATLLDRPDTLARAEGMDTITEAHIQAVIDTTGLVRRYHLSYTGRVGDETVSVTRRVAVTRVGRTTVGQPDWYVHAVNGTSEPTFGSESP